jgi:hypothetical protein
MSEHGAQEGRCHFKVMIGLEPGLAGRADLVQHENAADAGEDRAKQAMRAGEIMTLLRNCFIGLICRLDRVLQAIQAPLKKRLAAPNNR